MNPSTRITPASGLALVVIETILLFGCYTLAAYWARTPYFELYLLYDSGLLQIAFVVGVIQLVLYFHILYETPVPRSRLLLIQQCCTALGFAFLFQSISGYANWMIEMPRAAMIYGSLMALVVLPVWRIAFSLLLSHTIPDRKVLFLGKSAAISEIVATLNKNPVRGFAAAGYLDLDVWSLPLPRLGTVEELDQVLLTHRPDRIVSNGKVLSIRRSQDLEWSGIPVEDATEFHETLMGRVCALELRPDQAIFLSMFQPREGAVLFHNAWSLLAAALGIIVMSPLLIFSAILVKVSSRGPVLLSEEYVGFGGASFPLYQFRVDPFTSGGRFLRRVYFEKLPRLFNVLRGEMAIVGPRPERRDFYSALDALIPFYRQRTCVKPGLTGWAEINSKGLDLKDAIRRLEYDLYYIEHLSLTLDAYIVIHTFL